MNKAMLLLKDKSVLFAEDDIAIRTHIETILTMLFSKVYSASDGEKAYKLYRDKSPDIILTDIKMPNVDGLELAEQIRNDDYEIPIVLLTGYIEQELLLNATNLSIDGYLLKPIDINKLTSTLSTAIKRNDKRAESIPLGKGFYYDFVSHKPYRGNTVVKLGAKELALLKLLIKNRHKTVTTDEIDRALWPFDSICNSAIKSIILRLRKKLDPDIILCIKGVGYRINTETL